ncbi:MAG: agmatine deiminase family protein [Phycisphaerales bacterium]|nr:agmatine deiminase family protein [Phycisphaerales bacterium]
MKTNFDLSYKLGLVQMAFSIDRQKNIQLARSLILSAHQKGAKIICLPELSTTLYFPQDEYNWSAFDLAEGIDGYTIQTYQALSKELSVCLVVPFYEKTKKQYFNTTVVLEDGQLLGYYRKVHIPHDPLFYEKNYFAESNEGFKVFNTKYGKIAVLICFDQWFPEAARICTMQGAHLILYPTAIGYRQDKKALDNYKDAWVTIQRGHAIANGVFIAGVNRVGSEGNLAFWGNSFISNPFGKILAQADQENTVIMADITPSENDRIRYGWGFFAKRRGNLYTKLSDPKMHDIELPAPLSYRFPAEWEKHQGVLLFWPHDTITFPELKKVEQVYIDIIVALHNTNSEKIYLFVTDNITLEKIRKLLIDRKIELSTLGIFVFDYADVWCRDFGPTFVKHKTNEQIAMVKWDFNAWGNKYKELLKDDAIPAELNKYLNLPFFRANCLLEGGAIETNGNGILMTSSCCVLNKNRGYNKLKKKYIHDVVSKFLDIKKVIWLSHAIVGDDTDGHIDNLARFVNQTTIVCAIETNKKDTNYKPLQKNFNILKKAKDCHNQSFQIIGLPMPKVYYRKKRCSASYTNFYIANHAVLVPQFKVPEDKQAMAILQKLFTDRAVIGIDCSRLISGGGTLHCITQQIPY